MADELTTWEVIAETKEYVGPISVSVNDSPYVGAFDAQIVAIGERPLDAAWVAAEDVSGEMMLLIGTGTTFPMEPYTQYTLMVRITSAPEVPIIAAGLIQAS